MNKLKRQVVGFFAWVSRRWILCVLLLTVVFWILSQNILIGFMSAFLLVLLLLMIHALIQLSRSNHKGPGESS